MLSWARALPPCPMECRTTTRDDWEPQTTPARFRCWRTSHTAWRRRIELRKKTGAVRWGAPASLTRLDELAALAVWGLDRFDVQLCPGEIGKGLYKAIKKTAEGSTALLKHLAWPTPVNNRQAFAIAAFCWGGRDVSSVPSYALSVADFPTAKAERFDDHPGRQAGAQAEATHDLFGVGTPSC